MDRKLLLNLIDSDDLDLLKIRSPSSTLQDQKERLFAAFQEINDFICETGREPEPNNEDMREFALYSRLNSFRENEEHIQLLLQNDKFRILSTKKIINSVENIFENDELGLLKDWSDDIFDIKHIPNETTASDYVAQRRVCHNFQQFEYLFKQCQLDLTLGKRKLKPFAKEQQINNGDFFVLRGVLTYVALVGQKEVSNGKRNARLHCIFENGTESNMLLRSLARELYKDGRRVTICKDKLLDGLRCIESDDLETGFIYILKSLSQRPEIQSINHLYKIGFSRIPVEDRIKNATQEPTYLMAPVNLIASYQCINLYPQKFESLLHRFFSAACLNVDVFDRTGQRHTPREWFIAPIWVINQAVDLLISGDIVNYRYDPCRKEIVERV
ncbi:MAG TPA: GIY-YIG nuclease family protein [Waddliaceae bacterium]